jgi:DUF1365 family protein
VSAPELRSALYEGRVWHRRFKPRAHKLAYRVPMTLLDLDELAALDQQLRLLSIGRFNLMDFRQTDHLDGSTTPLKDQLDAILADGGFTPGGRVRLLCMPRVLGSVFNPLSVYFCDDPAGRLQAIVYEVNNTFGQRHSYLLAADDAGHAVSQSCEKRFFVSPFNTLDMTYHFRIVPPGPYADEQPLSLRIDVRDADGLLMIAAFTGERQALSDRTLFAAWLRHPLLMAKVVGAIHWEALKLAIKGLRLVERPAAPPHPVSGPHEGVAKR